MPAAAAASSAPRQAHAALQRPGTAARRWLTWLTWLARLIGLIGLVSWATGAAAQGDKPARLALVIGNAAYAGNGLSNPVNDARDMAALLTQAGFEVIERENLSLRDMHLAVREFGDRLRRETLGLFYFAGHGIQVRGRNYLLPIGADIGREDEVAFNALDLQAVLEKMDSARNHTNLIILDACRNNPFAQRFRLSNNGLAQIDAPPGTLVAFATAPGAVASDGKGRNGLYTRALLDQLTRPGVPIEDAFKQARGAVRSASKGQQTPWESTSLENELILKPAPAPVLRTAAVAPRGPGPAASGPAPAASGPLRGSAAAVPLGSAPQYKVGDWWEWKLTNQLSGETRTRRREVLAIQGDRVLFDNGLVRDRSGNTLADVVLGKPRSYVPSTLSYVFPLTPGLSWRGQTTERGENHALQMDSTITVVGEEELRTAFGKLRTIKVQRVALWKNLHSGNQGETRWLYWYAAPYRGAVRVERTSATKEGRVFIKETQELVALGLR